MMMPDIGTCIPCKLCGNDTFKQNVYLERVKLKFDVVMHYKVTMIYCTKCKAIEWVEKYPVEYTRHTKLKVYNTLDDRLPGI